jgi:ATP-dependent DNA ligase
VAARGSEATAAPTDPFSADAAVYVDHVKGRGRDFFEVACAHDLEGIVGKLARGRYHADGTSTSWFKIKNPAYTQMTVRHELFERRTGSRKRRPMLRVP